MTILLLALCMTSADPIMAGSEASVSREQMEDVLRSLHSTILDFEFRYEGEHKRLQEPDYSKLPGPIRAASERGDKELSDSFFQGTIAYREDDSVHLDLYDRLAVQEVPLRREITSLFKTMDEQGARSYWVSLVSSWAVLRSTLRMPERHGGRHHASHLAGGYRLRSLGA